MTNEKFNALFPKTPIIGMLHMSGCNPVKRALEELAIFGEEGVDAAILENYHGTWLDVAETLGYIQQESTRVILGVNILPNEVQKSYYLASNYPAVKFIQFDYVSGSYDQGKLDVEQYNMFRGAQPHIVVLGGVWPKYYKPIPGSSLESDLNEAIPRTESIVVTGEGTGLETPITRINYFRQVIEEHPLIVGAGITPDNAYQRLKIADGAIVGSCLKEGNDTRNKIDRARVRALMDVVKEVRLHKN
jgi:uncharacterized protein